MLHCFLDQKCGQTIDKENKILTSSWSIPQYSIDSLHRFWVRKIVIGGKKKTGVLTLSWGVWGSSFRYESSCSGPRNDNRSSLGVDTICCRKCLARSFNWRCIWVDISSIATELSDPGTIWKHGVSRKFTINWLVSIQCLHVSPSARQNYRMQVLRIVNTYRSHHQCSYKHVMLGGTYCSRIPFTSRPRSVTSRFILRANIRSESHWTKICRKQGVRRHNNVQ